MTTSGAVPARPVEGDRRGAAPGRLRPSSATAAAALAVFAVSRLLPIALTLQPELYGDAISNPAGDLARYAAWAEAVVGDGLVPYRDVDVEYPPGALPFVILPAMLHGARFSAGAFVALLLLVDLAGMVALLVLARRTGSWAGVGVWLALPPLLGVVLYGRLDLLPAVAVLLALERAHARQWTTGGLWLGLGAAAKLVPALFVPLTAVAAARRWPRVLAGAVLGWAVAWVPYARDTRPLWHDVVGYHATRGVHLESLWGSLLNMRRLAGGPVDLLFERGAFGITGPGAAAVVRWTTPTAAAIVLMMSGIAARRWRGRPDRTRAELPLATTATLALLLGTTRVFSPQFVVWWLAVAAVTLAITPSVARWLVPTLTLTVALTVLGYPLGFDLLRAGARWPAVVLLARNVVVLGAGVALTMRWIRGRARTP